MDRRWVLVLAAAGVIAINAVIFVTFWPPPSPPPDASPAQRLYFAHCVTCHGVKGNGSWRAALFMIHPSDLADPERMRDRSDQYLFEIIKQGGASLGKPGMPAFGFHLSDAQIRDVIRFLHTLPSRRTGTAGGSGERFSRGSSRPGAMIMGAVAREGVAR